MRNTNPKPELECVAKRLRSLKKRAGYSVRQMAVLLSVTPRQVSRWLSARSMPDRISANRLAMLFKVDESAIIPKRMFANH